IVATHLFQWCRQRLCSASGCLTKVSSRSHSRKSAATKSETSHAAIWRSLQKRIRRESPNLSSELGGRRSQRKRHSELRSFAPGSFVGVVYRDSAAPTSDRTFWKVFCLIRDLAG